MRQNLRHICFTGRMGRYMIRKLPFSRIAAQENSPAVPPGKWGIA
jgi:hypothetical protein